MDFNQTSSQQPTPAPTLTPTPTPLPANNVFPPSRPPETTFIKMTNPQEQKSGKWVVGLIVGVIIILIGGSIAFAYVKKLGPFTGSFYTEGNFFSSLLEKSAKINSLSYSVSSSFSVVQREADAKPFVVQVSNTPELREQYQNDAERGESVSAIISMLKTYSSSLKNKNSPYPPSLKNLLADPALKNNYYKAVPVTDPVSEKEYKYTVTENGKNFMLEVNFDTKEALNSIRNSYGYVATSTIIEGTKVTFTKNSYGYLYLSSEPPKPFMVTMQEAIRQIPPDVSASMSLSASSDLSEEASGWSFNLNAEGNFGDMTYKVNADALKKDTDYYFRINNIPSLFLTDLASLKGKWIKVPTDIASSSRVAKNYYSELGYLSKELPEYEKSYKENKQNFVELMKQIVSVADSEKLIVFKKSPKYEKIENRGLTRYELSIRKEAILPFYTKITDLINKDNKFKDFQSFSDQGMVEYLQSKEFNEVFDYYDKNVDFTFWVDSDGFPAIMEAAMRVVPPDTAIQLADKQMKLVFKTTITDINKPIDIKAPDGAIPLDQIMKDLEKNMSGYDVSGLSNLKANLSAIRAQAELVYDQNGGYGLKAFPLGSCKQTASTLFGDKDIYSYINKATDSNPSKATCVSKITSGKVNSYAISVPLPDSPEYSWCVDSMGSSKQITGALKKDSCN